MSIYANSDIATGGYLVSHGGTIGASDERIKKNIVDADDGECLEVLRLLKPKKYAYKDVVKRGEEPVWGFIAQEVANVLPHATQFRQDFLPNIYELANVSSSNVITFYVANTAVSDCNNFNDLGVQTLSSIHGGDLDDGQCDAATQPLTLYETLSCDVSGKIQYEQEYVLLDSSKTLTDVSTEIDCRSTSRSDATVTYTYSSTATSGTQSHRIQALCLSALAVCVTLLV